MIDIKFIRENPDAVRASQKGRGEETSIVDQLLALDETRRAAINEFESLRAEQNTLSKSVGAAKGDEKAALLENSKELANKVKIADTKRAEIEEQMLLQCNFPTFLIQMRQLVAKQTSLLSNTLAHRATLQKMDLNQKIT
jgi:seryl-tRNA synthetase